MIDVTTLTIAKAAEHLRKGDFSVSELVDAYISRIDERNGDINAYLEVFDDIKAQARAAEAMFTQDDHESQALLRGIPFAVKDNILIKGKIASSASKILEHYRAVYDATVIKKLKREGAVFLGRVNMDEFAMGSSTENSAFGVTKNPRNLQYVSGGSSGGSAAAVAMDGALAALGSDTGGSIRQPAAFCGVVGLKPTYGAVSRYGLMAMASSLDQIGPLAKTVEDAQIIFDTIAGFDDNDSTSVPEEKRNGKRHTKERIVVGVPIDFVQKEGVDENVLQFFNKTLETLKENGVEVREITLPNLSYALAAYYIIMPAEASTNLARYDGVRYGMHISAGDVIRDYMQTRGEGFGREVRRRILLGTHVLSSGYYDAYYNKAVAVRRVIEREFARAFEDVDAIVTPTTPTPAFAIGEKSGNPLEVYLADIFTVPANIAGIPALSVPCGEAAKEGGVLPVGIQLMAPHFEEQLLFRIGKLVESNK